MERELALEGSVPSAAGVAAETVETVMSFAATPAQVWDRLMFYEQIDQRPPLHLRMLLPVPIRTEGDKSKVGQEARCIYEGGHLIKRVTEVIPEQRYAFEVTEQALGIGRGMTLAGGAYTLTPRDGGTDVGLITRYTSRKRPRWLWRPIEETVCHSFHRHILRAMKRGVEAG